MQVVIFLAVVSQASDIGTNKRANQDKMAGTIAAQVIKISVSINDPTKYFFSLLPSPIIRVRKSEFPMTLLSCDVQVQRAMYVGAGALN